MSTRISRRDPVSASNIGPALALSIALRPSRAKLTSPTSTQIITSWDIHKTLIRMTMERVTTATQELGDFLRTTKPQYDIRILGRNDNASLSSTGSEGKRSFLKGTLTRGASKRRPQSRAPSPNPLPVIHTTPRKTSRGRPYLQITIDNVKDVSSVGTKESQDTVIPVTDLRRSMEDSALSLPKCGRGSGDAQINIRRSRSSGFMPLGAEAVKKLKQPGPPPTRELPSIPVDEPPISPDIFQLRGPIELKQHRLRREISVKAKKRRDIDHMQLSRQNNIEESCPPYYSPDIELKRAKYLRRYSSPTSASSTMDVKLCRVPSERSTITTSSKSGFPMTQTWSPQLLIRQPSPSSAISQIALTGQSAEYLSMHQTRVQELEQRVEALQSIITTIQEEAEKRITTLERNFKMRCNTLQHALVTVLQRTSPLEWNDQSSMENLLADFRINNPCMGGWNGPSDLAPIERGAVF